MKHILQDTFDLAYYLIEQINDVKRKVVFRLYRTSNIMKSIENYYQMTQNKILHELKI